MVKSAISPVLSFGGVWCNAVLLHLNDEDMMRALSELYRILKLGGVLSIGLKEGNGSEEIVEKFSSDGVRFYNYKTLEATKDLMTDAGFVIKNAYAVNERERFGAEMRDLNWGYCFGAKPN